MTKWTLTAEQLYSIQQERRALEEKEAILLKELKELSDHKSRQEGSFVFMTQLRKGSVEYSKIPVLNGINLELYRKEDVISWRLMKVGN